MGWAFFSGLRHLNVQKPISQLGEKTKKRKQNQNSCRYFETVFNKQHVSYQW
jgi:hypothetical protein